MAMYAVAVGMKVACSAGRSFHAFLAGRIFTKDPSFTDSFIWVLMRRISLPSFDLTMMALSRFTAWFCFGADVVAVVMLPSFRFPFEPFLVTGQHKHCIISVRRVI